MDKNIVKSINEINGKDVYTGDIILLDSGDGSMLAFLYTADYGTEECFEQVECDCLYEIENYEDLHYINDNLVSEEFKFKIPSDVPIDSPIALSGIITLGNYDDFFNKQIAKSNHRKVELEKFGGKPTKEWLKWENAIIEMHRYINYIRSQEYFVI